MPETIDARAILYGRSRRLRGPRPLDRWSEAELLLGRAGRPQAVFGSKPDGLHAALFLDSEIVIAGQESWSVSSGLRPDRSYPAQCVFGADGGHYFSFRDAGGNHSFGFTHEPGGRWQSLQTGSGKPDLLRLSSCASGCLALWTNREDPGKSGEVEVGYFSCGHRRARGTLDGFSFRSVEQIEIARGPSPERFRVACSGADVFGDRVIAVCEVELEAKGKGSGRFQTVDGSILLRYPPGEVAGLRLQSAGGHLAFSWRDPDEGLFFSDREKVALVSGPADPSDWQLLPSGEVVFAWAGASTEPGVFWRSFRAGALPQRFPDAGMLRARRSPEALSVGLDPTGAAMICWAEEDRILSQKICSGFPEMPAQVPGIWPAGGVSLGKPLPDGSGTLLPIITDDGQKISLWKSRFF